MTETVESRPTTALVGAGDQPQLYIGGQWVDPHSTETLEVFSPATGERVGSVPLADATDVDTAVATARAAFESGVWRDKAPAERAGEHAQQPDDDPEADAADHAADDGAGDDHSDE